MMKNKITINFNYSGLITILLAVFITLKLVDVIDWSWWWVISPIWLPIMAFGFAWLVIWIIAQLLMRKWFKK